MDIFGIMSLLIGGLGFVLAVVDLVLNYRLAKRNEEQSEKLTEMDLRIKELQLEKEETEAAQRASSKVEAHHVLVGLKEHRIRIANTGGTTVTNVTCEYDKSVGPYVLFQDKEPYERLEPGESFDENAAFTCSTPSKFTITTRWIDHEGNECGRENIISW